MYTEKQAAEDQEFIKKQAASIIQAVKDNNSVGLLGMIASSTLNNQITLQIIARLLRDSK